MFLRKLTILAAVILALGLGGAGVVAGLPGGSPPVEAPQSPAKPAQADPAPMPPRAAADAAGEQPVALPLTGHKGAVRAVAFSPDGLAVATAGADKTVRVWDVAIGRQTQKLDQPGEAVGVAFSPDGKMLVTASAGKDGTLTAWQLAKGLPLWRSVDPTVGGWAGGLVCSPDGTRVVASGEKSGRGVGSMVVMLRADSGTQMFGFILKKPAMAAAFSPDSKLLAVGDNSGPVHVMDAATGKTVSHWNGQGAVTALAFLPGGGKVVAADGGKAVRVLDAATGAEKTAFQGQDAIAVLALSADGKRLATAEAGGTVRLWDVAAGREERRFAARGAVRALALSPDGRRLATAGEDGAVVWDLTRDEKPLPKDLRLTAKELDALWADLAAADGAKAYAAARLLRADPARSVTFLQQHLKPKAGGPDAKKLKQLIADLDAEEFDKRESATKELEKFGRQAESALRAALAAGPSAEARTRIERLLKRLGGEAQVLTAEQQRDVRAVRVLEQVGTPEAKKLLEALVKESPGWWVAQEAADALRRLAAHDEKR